MSNRERNKPLYVRVTEEEKDMILQKMNQLGTSNFNAYAIKMLIDGYVIKYDFAELRKLTAELGKIGSNINQIARRANETRNVYDQDIKDILTMLHQIKSLTNEKIGRLIK